MYENGAKTKHAFNMINIELNIVKHILALTKSKLKNVNFVFSFFYCRYLETLHIF